MSVIIWLQSLEIGLLLGAICTRNLSALDSITRFLNEDASSCLDCWT